MSVYSATGTAWRAQRLRVLERDGWLCTACGKTLDGEDATVDHVEPVALSEGRDYRDDELVSMCRGCNSRKGARLLIRMPWFNPRWLASLA
ncbi:HNH endonuclease [Microbacterium sp. A94]|uniref:HNH endonuclease n=1 Tax=Microbacterium sp. A94 TaxID=3450717 RepID=UPI003F4355E9